MRKPLHQRRLTARLLLMIYVPMLLAISTHIHTEMADDITCEECLHHVCHESHVSNAAFVWDNCILCQLGTTPCLPLSTPSLTVYSTDIHTSLTTVAALPPSTVVSHHSPRAPPRSF